MLSMYPACFFKEENGYSVISPDLDLATRGDTMDEAMAMAVDCLAGRLHWLKQDGDPIPQPSPMNAINLAAISKELEIEPQEAFVNMVSVDVAAYAKEHFNKSVRKTLTIPAWLNTAALEMDINFSQVLQEALLAKVRAR
ncbi:MAG: HicB family protein [Lachnospiraceae bacterium]|jgi:predicted RNase H-like HicB family nuclease|nr:HicB family protein [Lachnospiraceae bacterium]